MMKPFSSSLRFRGSNMSSQHVIMYHLETGQKTDNGKQIRKFFSPNLSEGSL